MDGEFTPTRACRTVRQTGIDVLKKMSVCKKIKISSVLVLTLEASPPRRVVPRDETGGMKSFRPAHCIERKLCFLAGMPQPAETGS